MTCNLAIKVEQQLNGRKSSYTSLTKILYIHNETERLLSQVEALDTGKENTSESPKKLEGKKFFKCHRFRHFEPIFLIKGTYY